MPTPGSNSCTSAPSLIAPFWTNLSFGEDGALYFRTTVNSQGSEVDHDLTDFVGFLEQMNSNYVDFVPELQVVVTWFRASLSDSNVVSSGSW